MQKIQQKLALVLLVLCCSFVSPRVGTTAVKIGKNGVFGDAIKVGPTLMHKITCYTRLSSKTASGGDILGAGSGPGSAILGSSTKTYPVVGAYKFLVDDNGSVADYSKIQDALDAASDGDTIYVCPGTYKEQIAITKDVKLKSLAGADSTTIDASSLVDGSVVDMQASATLQGFTITGAHADLTCFYGGGIHISGELTGDDTRHVTETPIIQQNKIVDNVSCKAGGIYLSSAGSSGGERVSNQAIIRNNVVARNEAHTSNNAGIVVSCGYVDGSVVENNVVADGVTSTSGAGDSAGISFIGSGGCAVGIRNNIVDGNAGSAITTGSATGMTIEYNDSHGNGTDYTTGATNITSDPLFTDAHDYRIDASSPCVDAGDASASYNDTDSTRNDMGAYGGTYGNW